MGYRPRAMRGATKYDLPMPMRTTKERHTRVTKKHRVPLQPGAIVTSSVRGPLLVSFSGIITVGNPQDGDRTGLVSGQVTNVMVEKEVMEEMLIENDEPFVFYRFVSGGTLGGGIEVGSPGQGNRWFVDCFCETLEFAFSDQTVDFLPYSFTLFVPDGIEHTDT